MTAPLVELYEHALREIVSVVSIDQEDALQTVLEIASDALPGQQVKRPRGEPVAAYDLARDIAKELRDVTYDIPVEWFAGEPCASLDDGEVVRVVERIVVAALRKGGIKPC